MSWHHLVQYGFGGGGQNMPICELPSSFFDAQWQYEGHPAARPFWHGVRPRVEVVTFGGQKTAVTQKGRWRLLR